MTTPWLSVVGIGEDGLEGLAPPARALVDQAELLIGGARHLAMVPDDGREKLGWTSPLADLRPEIEARRGRPVCVLATGDPMHFGIGVTLARWFDRGEMVILPALSAFALVCSRLGWPLAEVDCLTVHGRPLDMIRAYVSPRARLIVLCENGQTPAAVAIILVELGYGDSKLAAFAHMGGPEEALTFGTAHEWPCARTADLVTLAIDCIAGPDARVLSRVPGLPDEAFRNDGQLTKREIRAATLAALGPLPGEVLWDVGAGAGSIAIEWMRSDRRCSALAIERAEARLAFLAENAAALGVPKLEIVAGEAPAALAGLAPPGAIFIGGGVSASGLLQACWDALPAGGRLVANVVTLEGEQALLDWQQSAGGELTRLSVERAASIGQRSGWRPLMTVTQYRGVKP